MTFKQGTFPWRVCHIFILVKSRVFRWNTSDCLNSTSTSEEACNSVTLPLTDGLAIIHTQWSVAYKEQRNIQVNVIPNTEAMYKDIAWTITSEQMVFNRVINGTIPGNIRNYVLTGFQWNSPSSRSNLRLLQLYTDPVSCQTHSPLWIPCPLFQRCLATTHLTNYQEKNPHC